MDWEDFKVIVTFILLVGLLLFLVFGGINLINKWSCFAKTSGMGFPVQYSFLGGCKIEVEPDKWIPLESYYFKQE